MALIDVEVDIDITEYICEVSSLDLKEELESRDDDGLIHGPIYIGESDLDKIFNILRSGDREKLFDHLSEVVPDTLGRIL